MELRDYANALKRHWFGIVLMTVLGLAVGYGWAAVQTPVYSADASGVVVVLPVEGQEIVAPGAYDSLAQSKVPTYMEMAQWRTVAEKAAADLGISASPESLIQRITLENPQGTPIIKVVASGSTPESARDLAEAWVNGLTATIDEREGTGEPGSAPITVQLAESASLPSSPSFPDQRMALAVGGVLGFGMGIAFALVRAVSDRRVRARDDVEQRLGIPVVGTLPMASEVDVDQRLLTAQQSGTKSSYAMREALRVLRTNLQFMDVDNPPRVIVVTSAVPGEGKSTVAANLAATLAANGAPVVLVDGDLRRPTVAKTVGATDSAGLTDVLAGRVRITDVIQRSAEVPHLAVVVAGTIPPNPSEVLGSVKMKAVLDDLAKHATVIVDAPPVLAVTDGAVLAHQADGALLVVSAGKTTYDLVEKARAALEKVHGRVLGVVLNRAPLTGSESSVYTYDYQPTKKGGKSRGRGRPAPAAPESAPQPHDPIPPAEPAEPPVISDEEQAEAKPRARTAPSGVRTRKARATPAVVDEPEDDTDDAFDALLRGATVDPPRRAQRGTKE